MLVSLLRALLCGANNEYLLKKYIKSISDEGTYYATALTSYEIVDMCVCVGVFIENSWK